MTFAHMTLDSVIIDIGPSTYPKTCDLAKKLWGTNATAYFAGAGRKEKKMKSFKTLSPAGPSCLSCFATCGTLTSAPSTHSTSSPSPPSTSRCTTTNPRAGLAAFPTRCRCYKTFFLRYWCTTTVLSLMHQLEGLQWSSTRGLSLIC